MNLKAIIDLKIDSVLRSPHLFQKFLILLVALFYFFLAVSLLLVISVKMKELVALIGLQCDNSLAFFFTVVLLLGAIDLLLKVLLRKNRFQFARLNYLPNTSKALKQYYYTMQLISVFLFYIPFLLSFHVLSSIAPEYGWFVAFMCIVYAYSISLFNSQLASFLKQKKIRKAMLVAGSLFVCGIVYGLLYFSLVPFFSALLPVLSVFCLALSFVLLPKNYEAICYSLDQDKGNTDLLFSGVTFGKSRIRFYAILFLKMTMRSPLLRRQFLMIATLSFVYIFMIRPTTDSTNIFMFEIIWPLVIFTFVPLTLSQMVFRAEGAFFDQLYMMPDLQNLLKARYVVGVLYSIVMVLIFCGIYYIRFESIPNWSMYVPAWLFSIGPFLLLSFLSIFVTGPKLDLFDSSWAGGSQNNNKIQSLILMVIGMLMIGLCYILFEYVSRSTALWTMGILGGVSVLFSFKYLDFIFKIYHRSRYKRMESYRVK